MLKKVFLALTLVLALGLGWAQGLETFENFPATGTSYSDGTFTGQDGSTWTYTQCRGDYEITAKALMIGRNRTPQSNVYSGTISGGIGTISFDYSQAFSTAVNLNVLVNDVVVGNVTATGQQGVVLNSGTITVNVGGDIVLKFINVNNSDGQVVIDNIAWTGYSASAPLISAIGTLNPFSAYTGTPSDAQSYTLTGLNLTAPIEIIAPAGFQISTNGGTTYTQSGSVPADYNGLIYVRLSGASAGSFDGNITHTSTGAVQVDKAVSGTVTDPAPVIHTSGTLTAFSTDEGTPSAAQSYTLYGLFLTDNINITAPEGFHISTDGGTSYAQTGSVSSSFNGLIYVRLTGTTAGAYSGNIEHTSTGATQVNLALSGNVTGPMMPTLFLEENFDYTVGTTVVSNGWSAHSGVGIASPLIDATNLSYTNYPPNAGGSVRTTGVTGEDISKGFAPQTEGNVYCSFLLNISSLPNTTQDYNFHLGDANVPTGGTTFRGRLFLQRDAENNIRFGISKGSASTAVIQFTPYSYAYNTTYMLVMKYSIVPGTANDEVYLWVNPTDTANEPTHTLFVGTADTTGDPTNIGSVAIRQSVNTPAAYYDGIRVANTWQKLWETDATNPVIYAAGDFGPFLAVAGVPSEAQFYTLSGEELTSNLNAVAPTGYELATDPAGPWSGSLSLSPTFNGTVYVRLNSATPGLYSGAIVHTSGTADPVNIQIEGEVFAPQGVINITEDLQPFSTTAGTPSALQTYALSGSDLYADIILTTASPFEISVSGMNDWQSGLILPFSFNGNIDVRMNPAVLGFFEGTISHASDGATTVDVSVSGTAVSGGAAADLFFSEYIEGSSNNKALEIFNGTGAPVDLSNYRVELYSNGATAAGNTQVLSGTLAAGAVYVIANSSSIQAILDLADITSTVTFFNGDDAVALVNVNTSAYVDIFGVIGNDPGAAWASGAHSTANMTLVRKPNVTAGITVNPSGTGPEAFTTLTTEWDAYPMDTVSYLGSHTFTPGGNYAATPTFDPAPVIYYAPINVTISTTTPGATIRYTTDGSDPSETEGTIYSTPIPVNTTTTIKAIAYADGFLPSSIGSATYTFPVFVSTIAELRAQPTGAHIYRLTGEAVLTFKQTSRNQKFVQDATAAILIDDVGGIITTNYNLYDGLTGLTGTLTTYSNLLQFVPTADPGAATSIGNVVIPEVRTFASLTSADQAKLIKVMNVDIDETNVNFGTIAENISATDPTATLTLRTFPNAEYSGTAIPVDPVNLICLVGQFGETMQVSPRFLADFEAIAGGLDMPVLTIIESAGLITVSWNAVTGATSYIVQGSDDPYTGFTTITTTNQLMYSAPATGMKFFRVIAMN